MIQPESAPVPAWVAKYRESGRVGLSTFRTASPNGIDKIFQRPRFSLGDCALALHWGTMALCHREDEDA